MAGSLKMTGILPRYGKLAHERKPRGPDTRKGHYWTALRARVISALHRQKLAIGIANSYRMSPADAESVSVAEPRREQPK